MLHRLDPLDRRFVKDSWPGVSITSNPGNLYSTGVGRFERNKAVFVRIDSSGKYVAPIC